MSTTLLLDGSGLSCDTIVEATRTRRAVGVTAQARERVSLAHQAALEMIAHRAVYGRTTGVGANSQVPVQGDVAGHGLRLLRSHAGSAGDPISRDQTFATLVIRLNQIAAGGSGVRPSVMDVLTEALNNDTLPVIHKYGALGTGDLTALAETGLTFAGERAWDRAQLPPLRMGTSDALAFMSSNAATLAEAVLGHHELVGLSRAAIVIAALSFTAVDGNREAFASAMSRITPQPGAVQVARCLRGLLGTHGRPPSRIQDPFSYRAFPQVHGPVTDSLTNLQSVLESFVNATSENPLIDVEAADAIHHGGFHTSYVGLALDGLRLAAAQSASLGLSRLGTLTNSKFTSQADFLTDGSGGSSGVLVLEYTSAAALGRLRMLAAPASIQMVSVSLGAEEDASFSTLAAQLTTEFIEPYRIVLACELVAAVRALRMRGTTPAMGEGLRTVFELAQARLPRPTEDRDLAPDIAIACDVVPTFADEACLSW